ncbi:MAG: hypothetical protein SGJ18_09490 [Pseudomonadota bacterium]|nr:hypothetical protein [Pseudomonadota bacterium]
MKRLIYLVLITAVFALAAGCSNKNNRKSTAARSTQPYYTGSQYGQQFYNNCGQQQYMNPYNNQQMNCQYGQGGSAAFYNQTGQQYPMDYYGNPCLTGQIDPYSGYCMDYSYYPMSW